MGPLVTFKMDFLENVHDFESFVDVVAFTSGNCLDWGQNCPIRRSSLSF